MAIVKVRKCNILMANIKYGSKTMLHKNQKTLDKDSKYTSLLLTKVINNDRKS